MNLVFKSPSEAPYEAGKDFSVVVICEDFATTERSCEILQLLGNKLKAEDGRLFHHWWNFEFPAIAGLRELFTVEAAAADMIIIGLHAWRELPKMVAWMKRLPGLRKNRHGALVAVLDSDAPEPEDAEGILSQLKEAAALGRMDFFATRAKEVRDAGLQQGISEVARQFVMRNN